MLMAGRYLLFHHVFSRGKKGGSSFAWLLCSPPGMHGTSCVLPYSISFLHGGVIGGPCEAVKGGVDRVHLADGKIEAQRMPEAC